MTQILDPKPSDYTLALDIIGGHRYFWFKSPGYTGDWAGDKLAVADNSGTSPHENDSGLRVIDTSKPFCIASASSFPLGRIPVIYLSEGWDAFKSHIECSPFEAFAVARLLGEDVLIQNPRRDSDPDIPGGLTHPKKDIRVSAASLYWDNDE